MRTGLLRLIDWHPTLTGAQIINYCVTPDEKWLVLVGIAGNTTNPSAFKVKGAIQLFSLEIGVSTLFHTDIDHINPKGS